MSETPEPDDVVDPIDEALAAVLAMVDETGADHVATACALGDGDRETAGRHLVAGLVERGTFPPGAELVGAAWPGDLGDSVADVLALADVEPMPAMLSPCAGAVVAATPDGIARVWLRVCGSWPCSCAVTDAKPYDWLADSQDHSPMKPTTPLRPLDPAAVEVGPRRPPPEPKLTAVERLRLAVADALTEVGADALTRRAVLVAMETAAPTPRPTVETVEAVIATQGLRVELLGDLGEISSKPSLWRCLVEGCDTEFDQPWSRLRGRRSGCPNRRKHPEPHDEVEPEDEQSTAASEPDGMLSALGLDG